MTGKWLKISNKSSKRLRERQRKQTTKTEKGKIVSTFLFSFSHITNKQKQNYDVIITKSVVERASLI